MLSTCSAGSCPASLWPWRQRCAPVPLLVVLVVLSTVGRLPVLADSTLELEVDENQQAGETIGYVSGRPSRGMHLTLVSRGPAFDEDIFVDRDTGEIRTKVPLDRERRSSYSLVAIPLSGNNTLVIIRVLDVNDNAPQFPQTVMKTSFSENTPRTVKRTLVPARDPDLGIFSTQKYTIVSGNDNDAFLLSPHRGRDGVLYLDLQINRILDRESTPFYTLLIEAEDGGSPPLKSRMELQITIEDVNDNQPIFGQSRYSATIPENTTVGTVVQKVLATDTDAGRNRDITYSINQRQSNRDELFRVDPSTGEIIVNRPLDFETERVHELIVVARDNGTQPLETSAFVSITVQNVNDNLPNINIIFLSDDASPKISEQAKIGDYVARISVSDPDTKEEYDSLDDLTLSGGGETFRLEKRDDVIYLMVVARPLDREHQPSYNLTVTARDRGRPPLQASRSFILQVTDANDNAPYFDRDIYRAELLEVVEPGTKVIQLVAHDADNGVNARLRYSIVRPAASDGDDSLASSGWFQVDNETGLVRTRTRVDCESDPTPALTLVVTDSGAPPLSSTATLMVTIVDVNDNEPVFDQSFYNVSVRENLPVGQCVLNVSATDSDCGVNGEVSYSLAPEAGAIWRHFSIDNSSGYICLAGRLDRERRAFYEFPVVATDRGGLRTVAMVKLHVLDVNDNWPRFYPRHYNATVWLSAGVGDVRREAVVAVAASDADAGAFGRISYSIAAGNEQRLFRIDETSGEVFLVRAVLRPGAIYRLQVAARDGGGQWAPQPALVTVTVVDRSRQAAPQFSSARYSAHVREDVPVGSAVASVHATISRANSNNNKLPDGALRYSIYSGDPDYVFAIDAVTGRVSTARQLDREQRAFYLLNIQAAVAGDTVTSQLAARVDDVTHTVPAVYGHTQLNVSVDDVNDIAPMFDTSLASLSVPESTRPDTVIYTAHAQDMDSGDNGRVTYRLLSVREEQLPPVVSAAAAANQSTAAASEAAHQTREAEAGVETAGVFAIEAGSGQLQLLRQLDFESRRRYRLLVEARDHGVQSRAANLTLLLHVQDANDNAPQFATKTARQWPTADGVIVRDLVPVAPGGGAADGGASVVIEVRVGEDQPVNTRLVQLTATDGDTGNNARLSYRLESTSHLAGFNASAPPVSTTTDHHQFGVAASTGWLYLRAPLHRQQAATHRLVATVVDHGVPRLSARVPLLVRITDGGQQRPRFGAPLYRLQVGEAAAVGTVLGQVVASDGDDPPHLAVAADWSGGGDGGANANLRYSVLADETNDTFTVDPVSGVIRTMAHLDRETRDFYQFTVQVSDEGPPPKRNTATVQVRVLDENDSAPQFVRPLEPETEVSVREEQPAGFQVLHVQAADADLGVNGTVSYSFATGVGDESDAAFMIDARTGIVSTTRVLDHEVKSVYSLSVVASDGGTPPRHAARQFRVRVLDLNDNSPVFTTSSVTFTIVENVAIGHEVGHVVATDRDAGENGRVAYTILSGNWNDTFDINRSTGTLFTTREVDYEMTSQYEIRIEAVDSSATNPQNGRITVTIVVQDVNDNSPAFCDQLILFSVAESTAVGATVWNFTASDLDSGPAGTVTYSLSQQLPAAVFAIDSDSGALSLVDRLDYEQHTEYTIVVTATDSGQPDALSSSVTAQVIVGDVNDNAPVFVRGAGGSECSAATSSSGSTQQVPAASASADNSTAADQCVVSVLANERVAFPVLHVIAVDQDARDNGRVAYRLENTLHSHYFSLDSETGLLTVARQLEPLLLLTADDTSPSSPAAGAATAAVSGGGSWSGDRQVSLIITASDHGKPVRSTRLSVRVLVAAASADRPVFLQRHYVISVSELAPIGSALLKLTTRTPSGRERYTRYRLPAGIGGDMFSLDASSGQLSTSRLLDRETGALYRLTVLAYDMQRPRRTDIATVTVTIADVNDNSPQLELSCYRLLVPENAEPAVVHTVAASDEDTGANAQITYSITDGDVDGKFSIDRLSGAVWAQSLDREHRAEYSLEVTAVDAGETARRATCRLPVTVGDQNDNAPVFETRQYQSRIYETAPVGTLVTTVRAVDRDHGDSGSLTYSLANETQWLFRIDADTGRITTAGALNRERQHRYVFEVRAADGGRYQSHWSTARVTVIVDDVNDHAPQFDQFPYQASVAGQAPRGQPLLTVSAADPDTGDSGLVTYSIVDGDGGDFQINPETGAIATAASYSSYRADTVYNVKVRASDGGSPSRQSETIVQLLFGNHQRHVSLNFDQPRYRAEIAEDADVGFKVLQVSAYSSDARQRSVTYTLLSVSDTTSSSSEQQQQQQPDQWFSVDRYSGEIRVRQRHVLDYERHSVVRLALKATTDQDNVLPGYASVVVELQDVNDNTPRFTQDQYVSAVLEGLDRDTYVIQVSATDADSGANADLIYSIVDGNLDSAFVLATPTAGVVRTNVVLDREIRDSYQLVVTASDGGSPPRVGSCSLLIKVIDINDNRPTFPPLALVSVSESAEPGSLVTSVTANDVDLSPTLVYSMIEGASGAASGRRSDHTDSGDASDGRGGSGAVFAIDRFSGRITLAKRLDRETRDVYTLTVSVSDTKHVAVTNLTVKVTDANDHVPVFTRPFYTATVQEFSAPGLQLLQLNASDADLGAGGRLTYSLLTATDLLHLDPVTGQLTTRRPIGSLASVVDQLHQQLQLVAAVSDSAEPFHTATTLIELRIERINRHSPRFLQSAYSASVSEDTAPGAVVVTVAAEDTDQADGQGRPVYYTFGGGNEQGHFQIASMTGEVILVRPLDREQLAVYQLQVVATDGGAPAKNASVRVTVRVLDVNDHEPRFSRSDYTASVSEDAQVGSLIVTVQATDADAGANAQLIYDIMSGDDDDSFRLDRHTGQIRLHRLLDYDTRAEHRFVVRATDGSRQRPLSALAAVRVRVTDVNDNAPAFPQAVYQQLVDENMPTGTAVFTALASDADRGRYGRLRYHLGAGATPWFSVDADSGVVRTARQLDREQRASYAFTVVARDAGGRATSSQVRVTVQDVDEFAPRFAADTFTVRCPADAPAHFVCGRVVARDNDAGPHGTVLYHLAAPHRLLAVNRSRGDIVVTQDLQQLDAQRLLWGEDGAVTTAVSDTSAGASAASRIRRQLEPDLHLHPQQQQQQQQVVTERLVVVASSGRAGSLSSSVTVYVRLDPSLNGLGRAAAVGAGLTGWGVGLLIAFLLVAAVFGAAFVFLHVRSRRVTKPRLPSLTRRPDPSGLFDPLAPAASHLAPASSVSTSTSAGGLINGTNVTELNYPPRYSEIQPYDTADGCAVAAPGAGGHRGLHSAAASGGGAQGACGDLSQRSASSGRGSAEDEEIRMINEAPLLHKLRQLQASSGNVSAIGGQAAESASHTTQQYLARLGIDTSHLSAGAPGGGSSGGGGSGGLVGGHSRLPFQSHAYHSYHQHGLDIGTLLSSRLTAAGVQENDAIMDGTRTYGDDCQHHSGPQHHHHHHQQQQAAAGTRYLPAGSLSSIVASDQELAAGYSWDYLLNWGPEYRPLAGVFAEIGRLKDDSAPSPYAVSAPAPPPPSSSHVPPPLITCAPPHLVPGCSPLLARDLHTARSVPASGATYVLSDALSPSFSPALSPLDTRPPSLAAPMHVHMPTDTPSGGAAVKHHLLDLDQAYSVDPIAL